MWVKILVKNGKPSTAHILIAVNKTNIRYDATGSTTRQALQYDVLLLRSLVWQTSSLLEQIWVGSQPRTCMFHKWSRRQRSKWMRKEQQPLQLQVMLSVVSRPTTRAYQAKLLQRHAETSSQSALYAVSQLTVPFGTWETDPVQVSVTVSVMHNRKNAVCNHRYLCVMSKSYVCGASWLWSRVRIPLTE